MDVTRLLQLRQDQALLYPEDAVNKHQIVALQKVSLPLFFPFLLWLTNVSLPLLS